VLQAKTANKATSYTLASGAENLVPENPAPALDSSVSSVGPVLVRIPAALDFSSAPGNGTNRPVSNAPTASRLAS
jgi:hypothetical protein